MNRILRIGLLGLMVGVMFSGSKPEAQVTNDIEQGHRLFQENCAKCHNGHVPKAPPLSSLKKMAPEIIFNILENGVMRPMARHLSARQKRLLAEYLADRKFGKPASSHPKLQCASKNSWFDYRQHPSISGWGLTNIQNTRFIPDKVAKLAIADIKHLKLKWAFSLPGVSEVRSQPVVAGGVLFLGGQDGMIWALDAKSGCLRWTFRASSQIRGAMSIGDWVGNNKRSAKEAPTLYFADSSIHVYAINAVTGKQLWKIRVDDHPHASLTGPVTLYRNKDNDVLFVPIASKEAHIPKNPENICCTHRGSVVALDARRGKIIWKTYVIPTKPIERYKNSLGVPQFGPAGAGVWTSPAIDEKRGLLYVGTGENSTLPAENGGAVVAINIHNGQIVWSYQPYPGESYNAACLDNGPSCPPLFRGRLGIDVASPLFLQGTGGKSVVVAANKPGDVFALDPGTGKILWRRMITRGDYNWGVLHGMATDGRRIFATVHDAFLTDFEKGSYWGEDELGVYAMDVYTGQPLWQATVSRDCAASRCRGYTAAPTVISGAVFVGAKDGYLRALDNKTGNLLWEFNADREFVTLNGDVAHGGGINPSSPVVAESMVYVSSGYNFSVPGNVFLAFSVNGK